MIILQKTQKQQYFTVSLDTPLVQIWLIQFWHWCCPFLSAGMKRAIIELPRENLLQFPYISSMLKRNRITKCIIRSIRIFHSPLDGLKCGATTKLRIDSSSISFATISIPVFKTVKRLGGNGTMQDGKDFWFSKQGAVLEIANI